jgi:hypothetical protein
MQNVLWEYNEQVFHLLNDNEYENRKKTVENIIRCGKRDMAYKHSASWFN